jgi:hypothetical protein
MKAQQCVDQRGFSGAVGAKQADCLALQLSCEPIEHDAIPEPDFQSLEIDDAHVILLRCAGVLVP